MNTLGLFRRYLILTASFAFLNVIAVGQPATDPVERSMRFVDQSLKATELFNAGKADQALTIFQHLLKQDSDLDEDGYVAVAVGDCLTALGRLDEARQAYQAAAERHPDLQSKIDQRLTDLALKGKISEALLDNLREKAKLGKRDSFNAYFQLERGLIKKASQLLTEAAEAATARNKAGHPFGEIGCRQYHLAALNELAVDLKSLIETMDRDLNWRMGSLQAEIIKETEPALSNTQMRWETVSPGKPAVKFEITTDKAGKINVSANGTPLKLTPAQQWAIQFHQQRINALFLEITGQPTSKTK